jgi:nicotinate-nucleotide adenylyltransferase
VRGWPQAARGQRIGLYGGSFDPPHGGHLHVSRLAARRLRLDRVWWLVSPGNPLKGNAAPLPARLAAAHAIARGPAIVPTDIEAVIGTRYTIDTLRALRRHYPGVRFVWIMGADSLADFHLWRDWRGIAGLVPIAVVDRPGSTFAATAGRAAQALGAWRLPEAGAARLADLAPPAFTILHGPRSELSSTAIRAGRPDAPPRVGAP